MLANHGGGPNDDQDIPPARPQSAEGDPEDTVGHPHPWSGSLGGTSGELLTKRQILQHEVGAWLESGEQRAEGGP